MDIKELKRKRLDMQKEITAIVKNFEDETNLSVTGLTIYRLQGGNSERGWTEYISSTIEL